MVKPTRNPRAWKDAQEEREQRTNQEIAADILRSRKNRDYSIATTERVYLDVPYREKELAKSRGAKWDHVQRLWYADSVGVLSRCERWHHLDESLISKQLDRDSLSHLDSILEG